MKVKEDCSHTMHIYFWWLIPCKAISGVFRELAELPKYNITVICAGDLSDARKRLGWEKPEFGKAEVIILPQENWQFEIDRILVDSADALHIYNGMNAFERILYSFRRASKMKIKMAVMTESQNNAFYGAKWLAKEVYWNTILPFTTRPLAKRSLFVLCLSGNSERAKRALLRLGWSDKQIFPFGYFSEQISCKEESDNRDCVTIKPHLLCTGLLTKNKGHHVLLRALSLLKNRGLRFHCDITGFGPEDRALCNLSKSLGLDDGSVTFKGVVPTKELEALMRSVDIFVAPGLLEPWGIRINEAVQAGLAVVVSDGIGGCELVQASGGGAVFPSGKPDQLAERLFSLISEPKKLEKCKQNSRGYRQRIHPCVAASYVDAVLSHVLEQKGNRPSPVWL